MSNEKSTQGISKSYLYNLVLRCAIIFIAGIVLTAVVFFFSVHQQLGSSYRESFLILSQLQKEMLTRSLIIYSLAFLLISGGIIVITLLYSHRVVGPMYRLSMFAKKISSGDLSETVVLRGNDAIQPLADELNNLITDYRNSLDMLAVKTEEFKEEVSLADAEKEDEERERQLAGLLSKAKELEGIVEKIKL